ncbi:MAG: hypothetical protein AAFZ18_17180, partial [Myxococcota bacterium]
MTMDLRIGPAALAATGLALGCAAQETAEPEPVPASVPASTPATVSATLPPQIGTWGVDLSTRDEKTKPGDDFNRFANGAWMDSYEMPADLSSYGTFVQLRLDAEADVRAIVEAKLDEGAVAREVGWHLIGVHPGTIRETVE